MKAKKHLLNHSLLIITLLMNQLLSAQNRPLKNDYNQKKWTRSVSFGLCTFKSDGIPPSRNQLNYHKINGGQPLEEATFGFVYDVKLLRKINRVMAIGFSLNGYNDAQERDIFPIEQNVGTILSDSVNKPSILTYQSYVNIGGVYEHQIAKSKNGKFMVNGSFALGFSMNRTPDRTEFDYFDPDGFVTVDTTKQGEWQHISTRFNHGFFIQPSIKIKYNLFKNSGILFEISQVFQWHSSEKQIQIMNVSSHGSIGNGGYNVSAQQFKIGYFF